MWPDIDCFRLINRHWIDLNCLFCIFVSFTDEVCLTFHLFCIFWNSFFLSLFFVHLPPGVESLWLDRVSGVVSHYILAHVLASNGLSYGSDLGLILGVDVLWGWVVKSWKLCFRIFCAGIKLRKVLLSCSVNMVSRDSWVETLTTRWCQGVFFLRFFPAKLG